MPEWGDHGRCLQFSAMALPVLKLNFNLSPTNTFSIILIHSIDSFLVFFPWHHFPSSCSHTLHKILIHSYHTPTPIQSTQFHPFNHSTIYFPCCCTHTECLRYIFLTFSIPSWHTTCSSQIAHLWLPCYIPHPCFWCMWPNLLHNFMGIQTALSQVIKTKIIG